MIGIYFSGTGNTKYCIEKFISIYDKKISAIPLEEAELAINEISSHDSLIIAYPIYYSNLPKIVRDFIIDNSHIWNGKKIFIIATMSLFSGDGAGVSARILKKYGATITGGLHIKMPDCICDVKALKRSLMQNTKLVERASNKLDIAARKLRNGKPTQEGLSFFSHLAGLFGQRLWFFNKTRSYSDKLKIDKELCVRCGNCVLVCPMNNLSMPYEEPTVSNRCTMCYRCINQCPQKAITLLGKKVITQYTVEDFLKK